MSEVEKKELEEMISVIDNFVCQIKIEKNGCDNCRVGCASYARAKRLQDAGYGKVEDYKKEIERLKEDIKLKDLEILGMAEAIKRDNELIKDLYYIKSTYIDKVEKLKEETIKEYMNKILQDSKVNVDVEYIKEIAKKEYGVE